MPTMGDRIRKARVSSVHRTQEVLGGIIGVSREAISQWERNEVIPEMENLIALAKATESSLDWLCGLKKRQESKEAAEVSQVWDDIPERTRAGLKSTIVSVVPNRTDKAS